MIAFERTKSVAGGSKRYGSTMLLNGSSFIELSRHEPSKQQPSLKISRHGAVQAFRGGLFMSIYLLHLQLLWKLLHLQKTPKHLLSTRSTS